MKSPSLRVVAFLIAFGLLGSGCQLSQVNTSTGLPYWPPAPLNYSTPAARPGFTGDPAGATTPQAAAWHEAAARWVGTPYQEGGRDRRGVDCSGFSDALYREVTGHGLARSSRDQWLAGRRVETAEAQPGDLLFFQTTGEPVSHVAVSMGGADFAHASTSKGVMFSSLGETYWSQRLVGARRMAP